MVLPRDVVTGAANLASRSGGAVANLASSGVRGASATVHFGTAVASKLEQAIDLHIKTLQAAQPIVVALAKAVDEGLIDDLRVGLRAIDATVTMMNRMGKQMDQTTALFEETTGHVRQTAAAATTMMDVLPATQLDIARLGEAMERMLAMWTEPIPGFDNMPGVKQARSALAAAGLAASSFSGQDRAREGTAKKTSKSTPRRPSGSS
jgi:hypothetical protein